MSEFESDEQLAQMLAEGTCRATPLRDMARNNQAGITEGMLRHMFAHRDVNGFADAFYKLGYRVYIIEQRFWRSVLQNRGKRLDGGRREQELKEASLKAKANVKARKATAPTAEA